MAASPTDGNRHDLATALKLGAVVLLILAVGVTIDSPHPLLWLVGYATILLTTLLVAVASRRQRSGGIPWPVVLLAGIWVWSALRIPASPSMIPAVEKVSAQAVPLLVLFLVIQLKRHGWAPKTWMDALIMLGLVFSVLETLLAFLWYLTWWRIPNVPSFLPPIGYRASGLLLGHPNILAAYVNLLIPIVVVRLVSAKSRGARVGQAVIGAVFLVALFLSSSRGGWLALVGALGVMGGLFLIENRGLGQLIRIKERLRSPLWLGAGLSVTTVLLLALLYEFGSTEHVPIFSSRSEIWIPALRMIRAHPFLGNGPGSFPLLYASQIRDIPTLGGAHAHNILLQIGVELGAVGLLIFVAFVVALVRGLRARLATPEGSGPFLYAYIGGLAAFSIHSMFDYFLGSSLFSMALAIMLALVLIQTESETRQGMISIPRAVPVGLAALILIPQALWFQPSKQYWDGVELARADQWEAGADKICQAATAQPGLAIYHAQCGLALSIAAYGNGDKPAAHDAVAEFSAAVANETPWPLHYADLGAAYLSEGNTGEAVRAFDVAYKAYPARSFLGLALGLAQERAGQEAAARRTYRLILNQQPEFAFLAFFQRTELRQMVARKFVDEYRLGASVPVPWRANRALWLGEPAAALEILEGGAYGPGDRSDYYGVKALAQVDLGRLDEAENSVRVASFIDPSNPQAIYAQSALARAQGKSELAAQLLNNVAAAILEENYSSHYYYLAFDRYFLPFDLLPGIPRGEIEAWMWDPMRTEQTKEGSAADPWSPLSMIMSPMLSKP